MTSISPSKRQLKREASYEAMVRSAMHAFHQRGYASTRVEDIVAGTGYTPGAFYFHFKNKADCFWHVVEYRERLRGDWQEIAEELDPQTTSLAEVVTGAMKRMSTSMEGVEVLIFVLTEFYYGHYQEPGVPERLAALYKKWRGELVVFLDLLQRRGWLSPGRDVQRAAAECLAYVDGLTAHRFIFGLSPDEFASMVLEGLLAILERQ